MEPTRRKPPTSFASARWFAPDESPRPSATRLAPPIWQDGLRSGGEWEGPPCHCDPQHLVRMAQPCHMHFKSPRRDDVKRGILMAGGFSDGTARRFVRWVGIVLKGRPRCFNYRNMLAMDAGGIVARINPVPTAVVADWWLRDKTTPRAFCSAPPGMGLPTNLSPRAGPNAGAANWKRQGRWAPARTPGKFWDEAAGGENLRQGLGRCRGRHRPAAYGHLHDPWALPQP